MGTGFIAIPRTILEDLDSTMQMMKGDFKPFFMPEVLGDGPGRWEYPTDDQAFCWFVRSRGFQVLASTYPRVTHDGTYTFRLVDGQVSPPEDRDIEIPLRRPVLV